MGVECRGISLGHGYRRFLKASASFERIKRGLTSGALNWASLRVTQEQMGRKGLGGRKKSEADRTSDAQSSDAQSSDAQSI
jgi:hypothetical protein